jgi:hypothetical protein
MPMGGETRLIGIQTAAPLSLMYCDYYRSIRHFPNHLSTLVLLMCAGIWFQGTAPTGEEIFR